MKITKSDMLYKYVISKNKIITIEEIFNEFCINKTQFIKLKFKIKEKYSEDEYINFLNCIKGPKLLLLQNQMYIDIPNFMIDNNFDKKYILDYFDMTSNEFTSMMQNLKKYDLEKYNKILLLTRKYKQKPVKNKFSNGRFNEITNFIIENNCGYFEVCKAFKINDNNINAILNSNKCTNSLIIKNVKEILKSNKESDKIKFKNINIFYNKETLKMLKHLIIKRGYSISDVALYFEIRYNKMNSFINKDLKIIDEDIYFEINNYFDVYKRYMKVIEYCNKNNVSTSFACKQLKVNEKLFNKNIFYLKHTKQYKQMKKGVIKNA